MYGKKFEKCPDTRECFGKLGDECVILQRDTVHRKPFYTDDKECPFCKCERDVSFGKRYSYNPISEPRRKS